MSLQIGRHEAASRRGYALDMLEYQARFHQDDPIIRDERRRLYDGVDMRKGIEGAENGNRLV